MTTAELQKQMCGDKHQGFGKDRPTSKAGAGEVPHLKGDQGAYPVCNYFPQSQRQVFRCTMLYGCENRTSALHRGRHWPRHRHNEGPRLLV